MSTTLFVRRHIDSLPRLRLFTTRELLQYGTRNAVDLILFKLVKSEFITRIARGVFRKTCHKAPLPSAAEVAKVKASAFARRIYTYGDFASIKSGLISEPHLVTQSNQIQSQHTTKRKRLTFYTDGPSTSFQYGDIEIQFKASCPRRRQLVDDKVGLLVKALWFLGKINVDTIRLNSIFQNLSSIEKKAIFAQLTQMPEWMRKTVPRRTPTRFREFDLYGSPMFESTIDTIQFFRSQNFNRSAVFY